MRFFEAVDGNLYPIAKVVKLSPPAGASKQDMIKSWFDEGQATLEDGLTVGVHYGQIEMIRSETTHFASAATDTHMLTYRGNDDSVFRDTVVGWAIDGRGEVQPVLSSGIGYTSPTSAVLMPDGSVSNDCASWPSEDSWRAYAIEAAIETGSAAAANESK